MARSVTARQTGDDYQARWFWIKALDLLHDRTNTQAVCYEAAQPRAFDDVVVEYIKPIAGTTQARISVEYYQIKWHTTADHRFGFKDLIDPSFINAKTTSLLQRLVAAIDQAPDDARFNFVTTARVRDDDPLSKVLSKNDNSLLVEKLFDQSTDASRMGQIRSCWRDHLKLSDDNALEEVVRRLNICEGAPSHTDLGERLSLVADSVGLPAIDRTTSDSRYDALPKSLLARNFNRFDQTSFLQMLDDEGIERRAPSNTHKTKSLHIRSFETPSQHLDHSEPENTLSLLPEFRGRYIHDDTAWQSVIQPKVTDFLTAHIQQTRDVRLSLDAHASIAYLAGSVLHLKSGINVELIQKGRTTQIWTANDGSAPPPLKIDSEPVGPGVDLVLAVSLTQPVHPAVTAYVHSTLTDVGTFVHCQPEQGPSQQSVSGGEGACAIADQLALTCRTLNPTHQARTVHLFAACPNSLMFYLGQQHRSIGPVIVYEFDFDQAGNRGYQPSFLIS